MPVIVPFVQGKLQEETVSAVSSYNPIFHDCTGFDNAYAFLLLWYWCVEEDLLVIEQDMLPTHQDFELMRNCEAGWCAAEYYVAGKVQTALGFTRFRKELMQAIDPVDLFMDIMELDMGTHWRRLDWNLKTVLKSYGLTVHTHPRVGHLLAGQFPV